MHFLITVELIHCLQNKKTNKKTKVITTRRNKKCLKFNLTNTNQQNNSLQSNKQKKKRTKKKNSERISQHVQQHNTR